MLKTGLSVLATEVVAEAYNIILTEDFSHLKLGDDQEFCAWVGQPMGDACGYVNTFSH